MISPSLPEVSVIVPTLNEELILPRLLNSLRRQRGVALELIVVDGGSTDGTRSLVEDVVRSSDFNLILLQTPAGRGHQFNAGARRARAPYLLFLHADSSFESEGALAAALSFLLEANALRPFPDVVGRFALRFRCETAAAAWGYGFYEQKARLNRPGCIHGDQGFLLHRDFFSKIGPFDLGLPFLEDERLAEAVLRHGQWLLLPAEIHTSARRFETEGLWRRQLLNALILNALAIGWNDFLRTAPGLYRCQDRTARLDLYPFFRQLRALLREMSLKQRCRIWYRTGCYVRDNGWQLLLALDLWVNRRRPSATPGAGVLLRRCEPLFDRLTDHFPGRLLATALVWCWFHLLCVLLALGRLARDPERKDGAGE